MTTGDVWITGARGFIGRHLAARLAASGLRVVGLGHGAWTECERWGVSRWLNADIASENLSQLAHDEGLPSRIFHLAGGSSVGAAIAAPREDFKRTVESTASLCDWMRLEAPAASLLTVSSAAVYGAGHDGPIPEEAPQRPYSPYGFHKLMMEQVCRTYADTYGLPVVITRLFSVYGPELRKQLLWDACQKLAAGARTLELGGTGAELRDWTEISDVVRALERAAPLASPAAPTLNLGTGTGTSVAAIGDALARCWGGGIEVAFSGMGRPGDPASLIAGNGRLSAMGFDWTIDVEDGVEAYVSWFRSRAGADAPS